MGSDIPVIYKVGVEGGNVRTIVLVDKTLVF
jgi:hypothetical protein